MRYFLICFLLICKVSLGRSSEKIHFNAVLVNACLPAGRVDSWIKGAQGKKF